MNTVVVGSKLKTQKSLALQYTNNEKSGREIKETIPFTTVTKRITKGYMVTWMFGVVSDPLRVLL